MYNKLEDVEKISTEVMRLGGMVLKHSVKIGTTGFGEEEKHKKGFHKEFIYKTRTYLNKNKLISIKLFFQSYLTLEKSDNQNAGFFLNAHTLPRFIRVIKRFLNMYYDEEKPLFVKKNGKLIYNGGSKEKIYTIDAGKLIKLSPYIDIKDDSDEEIESIMITFPDDSLVISLDDFETFIFNIEKMDLYSLGIAMMNYLGRPDDELGTVNSVELINTFDVGEKFSGKVTVKGVKRNIGDNKNSLLE